MKPNAIRIDQSARIGTLNGAGSPIPTVILYRNLDPASTDVASRLFEARPVGQHGVTTGVLELH